MAKTAQFNVEVNEGNSTNTLKGLKEELELINQQLEEVEIGSAAFTKLSDQARGVSSEIKTLEKTFEGLEPQQKAEAFVLGFEAVAGSVAIATGAMSLFGSESETLAKLEQKTQAAIAIAVGARSLAEGALQAKIAARLVIEKAATAASKAQIAVQTALNAVLNANPIGLIILAITGVVIAFTKFGDKIKDFISSALGPLNDAFEWILGGLEKLGQAIGIVPSEQEKAAARLKKATEGNIAQYERELKVATARGDKTIDIEKKIIREKMKLYKKNSEEYKNLQADLKAIDAKAESDRKAEAKKAADARAEEYKKQKQDAKNLAKEIALDAELIGKDEEQKALTLAKRKYDSQLAVLKKFGLQTATLTRLYEDEVNKITTDAAAKRAKEAEDKKKEQDAKDKEALDKKKAEEEAYSKLVSDIRDARAVSEDQQRQLELTKLGEYYDELIKAAQQNGIDTTDLVAAKNAAIQMKEDEFQKADLEKKKAYQQQIADLTIGAATNLISTLTSLNELFSGDTEAEQKKAFKRQQALQIAQTVIDTFRSATGAYSSLAAVPVVGPALGALAAAAAVAAGLANIKKIKEQKFEGASAGGNVPSGGQGGGAGGGGIDTATGSIIPIGQLAAGSIMTPNVSSNQPAIKTYVVAGDVKNGLEADAKIQARRTV